MSLLLNALRRASTARQADGEAIVDADGTRSRSASGEAGPERAPPGEVGPGTDGDTEVFELEAPPEHGRPIPWPAASADQAVARAVFERPRRRPGQLTKRLGVGLAGVVALALIALAGWYAFRATQREIATELARYDPGGAPQAGTDTAAATGADAPPPEPEPEPAATAGSTVGAQQEPEADAAAAADTATPADTTATADEAETQPEDGSGEAASTQTRSDQSGGAETGGTAAAESSANGDAGGDSGERSASAEPGADEPAGGDAPAHGDEPAPAAEPAAAADAGSGGASDDVVRRSDATPLRDALAAGYAALQAGELERARDAYERALRLAPDNRDALIGAAAVAQRQGEPGRARRLYRRVLADHPRDPYARAALAAMTGRTAPRRTESELKTLLQDKPSSPALHFALGNVYARESRWADAQQAYFEAARAAPEHPDYAYNLAVALDHLGEREAARRHYARALRLAEGRSPAFSRSAARRRLEQLRR